MARYSSRNGNQDKDFDWLQHRLHQNNLDCILVLKSYIRTLHRAIEHHLPDRRPFRSRAGDTISVSFPQPRYLCNTFLSHVTASSSRSCSTESNCDQKLTEIGIQQDLCRLQAQQAYVSPLVLPRVSQRRLVVGFHFVSTDYSSTF